MAILYTYPLNGEQTEKEPWSWRANYNDGTFLEQFELTRETGAVFHRSAEIDASKLVSLQLMHAIFPTITVAFPKEAEEVVHFYRHRQEVEEYVDTQTGEIMHRTWQHKIWVIGFRINKQFWLAYTDLQNNTIFSSDDKLFTNNGHIGN